MRIDRNRSGLGGDLKLPQAALFGRSASPLALEKPKRQGNAPRRLSQPEGEFLDVHVEALVRKHLKFHTRVLDDGLSERLNLALGDGFPVLAIDDEAFAMRDRACD